MTALLGACLAQPAGAGTSCNLNVNFSSFNGAGFTFRGGANHSGGRLRLTGETPSQAGAIWYFVNRCGPLDGFDTTFTFQLDGQADGIAFVIQDDSTSVVGASGGGLGYEGVFRSVAVEIDTACGPGEFGCDHISVQTNGASPNGAGDGSSLAHASLPIDVNDSQPHTLRITYTPGTMAVYFDGAAEPLLVAGIDIDDMLISDLNGCMLVGFTGATGSFFANQWISSWSYSDTGSAPEIQCGAEFGTAFLGNRNNFNFAGSAFHEGGSIVLTPAQMSRAGAAWYRLARAHVQEGFTTEFAFKIEGNTDGIAFVFQSEGDDVVGVDGSGMGYHGIYSSLAVEFDTYCFGDEWACDHVSVQTNSTGQNIALDAFSLGHAVLTQNLDDGQPHTAKIEYSPGTMDITVDGVHALTVAVDLDEVWDESILDADGCVWIGFTGGTGGIAAKQSITSWTVTRGVAGCVGVFIEELSQPVFVSAPDGFQVHVDHSGTPPFTYNWFRNALPLLDGGVYSGATTDTLVVSSANTETGGVFTVVVSNACSEDDESGPTYVVVDCPGNANGDTIVDFNDITTVLSNWLEDFDGGSGTGDANGDGVVDFNDITAVLSNWLDSCE